MTSLMKRTLGTGAMLALLALSSPAQNPESILPEGTLFYVGSNDVEAFISTTKSKPLGKIASEQEVQDFLQKPLSMLQGAIDAVLAEAKQNPAMKDFDIDPKKIVAGPYGRAFFALTHIGMPEDEDAAPDLGLVIGLEPKEGALDVLDMMRQMMFAVAENDGEKLDAQQVAVGQLQYERARGPDGDAPPLCFAKIGGISVLSLSEQSMKAMLSRVGGEGAPLSASVDYTRCVTKCGSATGGNPVMYFHVGRLMQTISGILGFAAEHEANDEEKTMLAMVDKLLVNLGLTEMGPVYATSTWDGDVAVSRSYFETNPQAGGLLAAVSGNKPIDKGLLKIIPKNALAFSLSQFDLAPLWDGVMDALKDASPELHQQAMQAIQGVCVQVGGADEDGNPLWDLRRDLIGAVGGDWVSMSLPGPATMFGPGGDWVGWMGCRDGQALQQSLQYLFALPGQLAGFPVTFKEQTHGEVTMKVLDTTSLGPMAMMAGSMQPTYAIHGSRLYMASSPKAMIKLFDSFTTPPEENITAKQDFARHWSKMDQESPLTSLSYGDTATNFENGYTAMLGMIPMLMMGAPIDQEQLPFEMSLLPTAEVISQHLFGSVSASYQFDDAAVAEARGPFGAELGVVAAGLVGGVMAGSMVWASEVGKEFEKVDRLELEEVGSMEPAEIARQDLRDLSAAITVYIVEFNDPPATLDELVQPKDNYPNGVLMKSELPVDPWGHAYHYKTTEEGGYTLWSNGANGTDEGGEGDDIKLAR